MAFLDTTTVFGNPMMANIVPHAAAYLSELRYLQNTAMATR